MSESSGQKKTEVADNSTENAEGAIHASDRYGHDFVSPYPGLRPFQRDESALFFGRESCVDEMVAKLESSHFLAVLGPSGSGKSSLVRTGLIEALYTGSMSAGSRWLIADMRPAGRPIENLARALLRATGNETPTTEQIEGLTDFLWRGERAIEFWCGEGNLPIPYKLLIIADQFEELFSYAGYAARNEAEGFVRRLIAASKTESSNIYVVMTMRSEYLGPCALFPDLTERINAGLYLTRRMTTEEIREAIIGPSDVCGFSIETRLVDRIVHDLAGFAVEESNGPDALETLARRADQLPLMQHALNQAFLVAQDAANAAGARIFVNTIIYEGLGGQTRASEAHGERVLKELGADAKVAELVFQALVPSESTATVRGSWDLKTLAVEAEQKQDAVKKVVRAFSVTGCDFLQTDPPGPLSETTTVEIRPESLIRQAFLKAQAAANAARAILVDTTTYEGLGGLTGALEAHGKRVLEELGADAEVAEPVFRALVKSDSIATVRRPCDLRTLVVLAGQKQEAVENVIRAFSATGCDFLQTDPPGPLTKTTTVEIRHESLIRQWPRLKEWAGKEATERTNYAELAHDAIKWRTAHGAIRRGLEEEALAWGRVPIPSAAWAAHSGMELPSANHTDVKAYLAAARRRRKRIRNINRILVVSVAGLVSLLAVSTAGLTNIEAHFGNASAQDRMGDSSFAKKEAGAFYWYNKAAVQGDLHGEYMVGYMSYYGTYIDKNNTVAFAMLSQAVKNTPQDNDDWSQANFLLGEMFESAGGPQHELAAVAYYSTAAAGPYPSKQATYHLGEVYQNGINGVKIDMKKALDLYAKDAALGDPLGAQRIGDINQTEKNYLRAMAAYQQALKLATDAVKADSTDSFDATSAAYIDKAMGDLYNTGETGPAPAALQRANAAYADGINYAFKSLQMNPTDPDAQNIDVSLLGNEAWNEIEQGQFKLALQDANQSVSVASRVGSAATSCVTPNLIGGLPSCLVWTRTNVADSELLLGMIDQAKAIYENKDDMALNADGSGYSWKDDVRHDFKALTDGDNDNKTPPPLASVPPAERQEILQTIDAVKTAYASP